MPKLLKVLTVALTIFAVPLAFAGGDQLTWDYVNQVAEWKRNPENNTEFFRKRFEVHQALGMGREGKDQVGGIPSIQFRNSNREAAQLWPENWPLELMRSFLNRVEQDSDYLSLVIEEFLQIRMYNNRDLPGVKTNLTKFNERGYTMQEKFRNELDLLRYVIGIQYPHLVGYFPPGQTGIPSFNFKDNNIDSAFNLLGPLFRPQDPTHRIYDYRTFVERARSALRHLVPPKNRICGETAGAIVDALFAPFSGP